MSFLRKSKIIHSLTKFQVILQLSFKDFYNFVCLIYEKPLSSRLISTNHTCKDVKISGTKLQNDLILGNEVQNDSLKQRKTLLLPKDHPYRICPEKSENQLVTADHKVDQKKAISSG